MKTTIAAFKKIGRNIFKPQLPELPGSDLMINKSACLRDDLAIISVSAVANEIMMLKKELAARNLKFTTWMGDFTSSNEDAEMGKLWENAWILAHSEIRAGTKVLDAGGASTIFSFYLASKGCEISVIDSDWLNQGIIENAIAVSLAMNWKMKVVNGDITSPLPYPDEYFDFVFCICVLEHLTSSKRRKTMRNLSACLKKGGLMGITIDYDINRSGDHGLRFGNRNAIDEDIILPSGLALHGNDNLVDEFGSDFFLGALFLKK